MLFEVVVFGGFVFWLIFAVITFVLLLATETSDGVSGGFLFLCSIGLYYLFSNPPVLDWYWYAGYFVIGLVWFFVVFNYKLAVLKKWLDKNPEQIKESNISGQYIDFDHFKDKKYKKIYSEEPSFVRFFDRVFAWPLSMISIFLGDFSREIYEWIATYLESYKYKFLGINRKL